jgi:UDPglucose 6-dehydrogenase
VDDVAKGMGLDRRIGNKFLHAGIGYGGSCLPKDVSSLIYFSKEEGYDPRILMAVHDLNKLQVTRAMQKIQEFVGPLEGKTIGVLGLSFKPNTDDLREAPTIRMIEELLAHKAIVKAFDPIAMDNCKEQKDLAMEYCKNPYDVAEDCHALILGTEWNEFRELDLKRLKSLMNEPIFIDCRNVYRPKIMEEQGFRYQSFGRGIKQRS